MCVWLEERWSRSILVFGRKDTKRWDKTPLVGPTSSLTTLIIFFPIYPTARNPRRSPFAAGGGPRGRANPPLSASTVCTSAEGRRSSPWWRALSPWPARRSSHLHAARRRGHLATTPPAAPRRSFPSTRVALALCARLALTPSEWDERVR